MPTPDMRIELPLLDLFGRGGALKSSWYGDCLPERDFPMLTGLYLQGRLPLEKFVSETIALDGVEDCVRQDAARRGAPLGGEVLTQPAARIAMWSGPRTVSTALMRSFGNRPDTVVADEPLYAFYLARTGISHPGRDEILAAMPNGWREVLDDLTTAPLPGGQGVFYGKHMTHHLLPEVDRAALAPLRHAYLIRDPAELLASYARVRSDADPGRPRASCSRPRSSTPFGGPVMDSRDLLEHPEPMLRALCAALGVPFAPAMLSWPAGPRETDGVWGPYWYDSVWRSTGFGPYRPAAAGRCPPGWPRWPGAAGRTTSGCTPTASPWPTRGGPRATAQTQRRSPCCRSSTSATAT